MSRRTIFARATLWVMMLSAALVLTAPAALAGGERRDDRSYQESRGGRPDRLASHHNSSEARDRAPGLRPTNRQSGSDCGRQHHNFQQKHACRGDECARSDRDVSRQRSEPRHRPRQRSTAHRRMDAARVAPAARPSRNAAATGSAGAGTTPAATTAPDASSSTGPEVLGTQLSQSAGPQVLGAGAAPAGADVLGGVLPFTGSGAGVALIAAVVFIAAGAALWWSRRCARLGR